MPKRKKTNIKKNAWKWFSKYVRLRDALLTTGTKTHAKCVTCGKTYDIKEMNAGHYKHNAYDYDERNVHAQCVRCNKYLSGELALYRRYMVDTYGKEVADFFYDVRDQKIYSRDELETIEQEYKELYKDTFENN